MISIDAVDYHGSAEVEDAGNLCYYERAYVEDAADMEKIPVAEDMLGCRGLVAAVDKVEEEDLVVNVVDMG